ncbi:MAG: peptidoglycan DD-metalloendopeptidase family protein [Patescibacteria group bacterium]
MSASLFLGSLGGLSVPVPVAAGLFSSIFGEASAETVLTNPSLDGANSQTMALLEANFSSASVRDSKSDVDASREVSILSDNALLAEVSPLGALGGTGGVEFSGGEVNVYVVRPGDTVSQVAQMFDISVDTVLSANDLQKGAKLKVGDILLILPFSGVEHTVKKGDTLQGIANLYKVDVDDILLSNDIEAGVKLSIGEKLMIPGANIPSAPRAGTAIARGGTSQAALRDASGYFTNPVPGARRTRGITSTHRGVDLAAPTGTPILAAAEGIVTFARTGWNGGYGVLTIISHPNGTQTIYAHQSRLGTSVGARVEKSETIGYVGNTGRSTGPHLHIEVKGAKNPF